MLTRRQFGLNTIGTAVSAAFSPAISPVLSAAQQAIPKGLSYVDFVNYVTAGSFDRQDKISGILQVWIIHCTQGDSRSFPSDKYPDSFTPREKSLLMHNMLFNNFGMRENADYLVKIEQFFRETKPTKDEMKIAIKQALLPEHETLFDKTRGNSEEGKDTKQNEYSLLRQIIVDAKHIAREVFEITSMSDEQYAASLARVNVQENILLARKKASEQVTKSQPQQSLKDTTEPAISRYELSGGRIDDFGSNSQSWQSRLRSEHSEYCGHSF